MFRSRFFYLLLGSAAGASLAAGLGAAGLAQAVGLPPWAALLLCSLAFGLVCAALWYAWFSRVRALARRIGKEPRGELGSVSASGHLDGEDLDELSHALHRLQARVQHERSAADRQRRNLQAALAVLPEGVLVLDHDKTVVGCNAAAAQLLGRAIEDILARSIKDGTLFARLADLAGVIQLCLGNLQPLHRRLESRVGGQAVVVDVQVAPVENSVDSDLAAVVVLRDITAESANQRIRTDFVANASHELRTPIAAIKAALETLRTGAAVPGPGDRFLAMIERNVQRLEALTTDLLDLSRIESPDVKNTPSLVVVDSFWQQLRQAFEHRLAEKQVQLEFSGDVVHAWVDPRLLFTVLRNLVDNSLKFVPEGTGRIHVLARQQPGRVIFSVEDNGCGIPPEDQPRVFERFYQVDKSRSGNTGTGLGLAIVKHATAAMGGTVTLTSTVGEGTTVTLDVPLPRRTAAA